MEPMTLGSPTHSPSAGGSSPGSSGYLPTFLLGEITSPSTPHLRTNSLSPTKGRNLAFGSPMSPPQTSTPDQKMYRPGIPMHQQAMYNQQHNPYSNVPTSPNMSFNKPNGPPIEDLFDTIKKPDHSIYSSNTFADNSLAANNNSILQGSQQHSNLNHSVYSQSMKPSWQDGYQEPVEEHWVTVFGFPPSTANTVLARLYNSGTIIDKQYPTQGNWAHIRYATRGEKERALALNGRQISPGIMVGVVNCKETPRIAVSSPKSAINSPDRSGVAARPLCPTALPSATAPQGSTGGLVSKTMEYLFGW